MTAEHSCADDLIALLPPQPADTDIARLLRIAYLRGYTAALEADAARLRAALDEVCIEFPRPGADLCGFASVAIPADALTVTCE